ncbi:protein unc-93 homolog B1 isoform 2-T3 [Rhinophrynus dorsalis]
MADMARIYQDASINGVAADGVSGLLQMDDTQILEGANAQVEEFLGEKADYDEEAEEKRYYRRKRLLTVKSVVSASLGAAITYGVYLGLLQMQLILHYDETYRDVKYSNMGLQDIDSKMLMGINVTPIAALLYTPVLIRFFGTKWMLFLSSGIYALFVSTNYWERYYTLVPSATVIGVMIVPFWASVGNYITRMAQKYYEFVNYKEENVREQRRIPRGASHRYIIIFQSIFYSIFHISFVLSQFPVYFFLGSFLYSYNHTLFNVRDCGASIQHGILPKFNVTVLHTLPPSVNLIYVESALMGAALVSMLLILALCGSAYRPTEEIDLRSIGWGNIFQLPFKHARDYRLRCLAPYFLYSGFEVLFACTGFTLAKLGIMLASALISVVSYLWMEHKLACKVPYRVPKIPAPRHKVKGYRYIEEDNSDESGSEEEGEERRGGESEEEEEHEREKAGQGYKPQRKKECYEQAVEEE